MEWPALRLSLLLAAATSAVLLLGGVPLAAWLASGRSRLRAAVELLATMPLVLPPTVLGFFLLAALGPRGAIGAAAERLGVGPLVFSFPGLLIGSVLFNLPFALRPFVASLRGIDRTLLEAARGLGAGRIAVYRRIALPLAAPGIAAGVVLAFAHTLGEFGVALMVGGNIPGSTRTMSIVIYDHVQALDYAAATRTALVLMGCAVVALAALGALRRRGAEW